MAARVCLLPEWTPHRATLLAWPHNAADWPGKFRAIPWVYTEIVRALVPGEEVIIVVQDAAHAASATQALKRSDVAASRVRMCRVPLDRGWVRDTAPFFVRRGERGQVVAVPCRFNAWARYGNWERDARFGEMIAGELGISCASVGQDGAVPVLEGGAVDSNGAGTLLTTEECLLDTRTQVRNPGWTRADYERYFRNAFGVRQTLWLGRGIAGDDTHGHVDDLCRFVREDTVVLAGEQNPADPNHIPLKENAERLADVRLENGASLEVVPLPMPAPRYFEGVRLPATYANFYIGNEAVLVPTYNDPNDRMALGILAELFPDRRVVGIHATDLVWGFGAIHCLAHEVPA